MAALLYDLGNQTCRLLAVRKNSFFTEQGKALAQLPQQCLDNTEVHSKWEMHSIKSWEYLSQRLHLSPDF